MQEGNLNIDIAGNRFLKRLTGVVVDTLLGHFTPLVKGELQMRMQAVVRRSATDLYDVGSNDGITIVASDKEKGYESGVVLPAKLVKDASEILMKSSGISEERFASEMHSMMVEVGSQLYEQLNERFSSKTGDIYNFTVDSVAMLENAAIHSSEEYVAFDIVGSFGDKPLSSRFYIDEYFYTVLEHGAIARGEIEISGRGDIDRGNLLGAGVNMQKKESRDRVKSDNPNLEMLLDVEIPVSVKLGSAKLFLKDIFGLGPGNIVELDQGADESVELHVNDKLVARGEIVVIDGYFGFRIKEIISKAERIEKLKD